jgi:hypothetical protein
VRRRLPNPSILSFDFVTDSVHRRNHKERAQPLARAKLGLLEKKKDYVLRARDYKSKKERLKRLREKAAFRNKDEFYWGMIKSRTQGGVHVKERDSSKSLGVDEVKLLKSQDAGYVRLAIAKDESVSRLIVEKEGLLVLTSDVRSIENRRFENAITDPYLPFPLLFFLLS